MAARVADGEVLAEQLDYWRKRLAGAPAMLELPMARPRPRVQTYKGSACKFRAGCRVDAELEVAVAARGVTLFMTLLAGWKCCWQL